MRRSIRFSFTWSGKMLLCFACGILAGTGAAAFFGEEILERLEELGMGIRVFQGTGAAVKETFPDRWRYLLRYRFTRFLAGGLLLTTPIVLWVCMLFFLGIGFYSALSISVLTLESGWRGLFLFLRAVLPQWLIYGPVWLILAYASGKGVGKLRPLSWLFLIVAVVLGSFLEAVFHGYLP